jgi:16S rRNA (cytidine1402-2'-O)-methyltransferase
MLEHHGISDPGEVIVKAAIQNNIEIIPIPGACAAINALISSGMKTNEFIFIGFLPVNNKEKKEKLEEIKKYTQTVILYEAPHKLINTLKSMLEEIGDRNICLAREITKIHEEYIRGRISEVLQRISEPKGEYVLILEGNDKNEEEINKENLNKLSLEEHFEHYKKQGLDKKEIIKKIAKDRNTNKNEIYQYFL